MSVPLVRVSLILASFCALSFAASASTDKGYREAFLEPILHEARVNLAARHAYVRSLAASESVPAREAGEGDVDDTDGEADRRDRDVIPD